MYLPLPRYGEAIPHHLGDDRVGTAVGPAFLDHQPPVYQCIAHRRGMQPGNAMDVRQNLGADIRLPPRRP